MQHAKPMTNDEVIQRLTKMGIKIELFYEWLDSDICWGRSLKDKPYYSIIGWFFVGLADRMNYSMSS